MTTSKNNKNDKPEPDDSNFIIKWLISDLLDEDKEKNYSDKDIISKYFNLVGRWLLALMMIMVPFILITISAEFLTSSIPFLNESFLHKLRKGIDVQLDGQTIANYVGIVFGTVVALAGSIVAILLSMRALKSSQEQTKLSEDQNRLMEEQTKLSEHQNRNSEATQTLQIKSTKHEDPRYQQAFRYFEAAQQLASIIELLVAGMDRARDQSYIRRTADIAPLISVCRRVRELLYQNLIPSGLFTYLHEVAIKSGHQHLFPNVVQLLIQTVDEIADTRIDEVKIADTKIDEAEIASIEQHLKNYIVSMASFGLVGEMLERVKSPDVIYAELTKNTIDESVDETAFTSVSVRLSPRVNRELKKNAKSIVDEIASKFGLTVISSQTAKQILIEELSQDFVNRCYEKGEGKPLREFVERYDNRKASQFSHQFDVSSTLKEASYALYRKVRSFESNEDVFFSGNLVRLGFIDVDLHFSMDCIESALGELQNKIANDTAVKHIYALEDLDVEMPSGGLMLSELFELVSSSTEPMYKEQLNSKCKELSEIYKFEKQLFVVWLDSDKHFYEKLYLTKFLPWCVAIWTGYPYLPNPGVAATEWFKRGDIDAFLGGEPPSMGSFITTIPVIVTGGLSVNIDETVQHKNAEKIRTYLRNSVVWDSKITLD
ncbi:MAG: hypothetical protein PHO76_09300 [Methylotenera sp.]|nr:hypothetical protein [Methylotenera sp.]MDD4925957.1 hypothetical protein [Methylotenera sp.]